SEIHTTNPNKQNNKYEILKEKCNSGDIKACLDSYPLKYKKPIQAKLNGKWGFIDKNGKFAIEANFDWAWDFKEDLASVRLNGKYGFIDKNGKFAIKPIFDKVYSFNQGIAKVKLNEKWGLIDKNGNFIVEPIFDDIDYY
ncbi:TPA: WG repeat-containing protein, partial [Campylobacter lari]|nr:WG repeat-containing protein [Campylobacter lari]